MVKKRNSYLQKIPLDTSQSFSVQLEMGLSLNQQHHYHQEYELLYIKKGAGTIVVGNRICNLKEDDMFLIGPNVPHMMLMNKGDGNTGTDHEVIAIHFLPEFVRFFIEMPENETISTLCSKASHGLVIQGGAMDSLKELVNFIRFARNSEKIITLLQILNIAAVSGNHELMSHVPFGRGLSKSDDNRLNKIYHYTLNNFSKAITLSKVADIVNLCPHSFCRYFKSKTKKRYSAFLMEIRLNYACKLLLETDYGISIVSYESGYMNLSNFNRHFKSFKGKTPLEYRRYSYLLETTKTQNDRS